MGRFRDPGDLQYDAAAGARVRERRFVSDPVLPVGRAVRDQLRRPEGEVSEPAGNRPAETVGAMETSSQTTHKLKVGLLDFEPLRIAGLREIFAEQPDFQVVATDWATAFRDSA